MYPSTICESLVILLSIIIARCASANRSVDVFSTRTMAAAVSTTLRQQKAALRKSMHGLLTSLSNDEIQAQCKPLFIFSLPIQSPNVCPSSMVSPTHRPSLPDCSGTEPRWSIVEIQRYASRLCHSRFCLCFRLHLHPRPNPYSHLGTRSARDNKYAPRASRIPAEQERLLLSQHAFGGSRHFGGCRRYPEHRCLRHVEVMLTSAPPSRYASHFRLHGASSAFTSYILGCGRFRVLCPVPTPLLRFAACLSLPPVSVCFTSVYYLR